MYTTPPEYFCRLHHIRPRFKSQVESVLIYLTSEISKLGEMPIDGFATTVNNAIRLFGGNARSKAKTINNWRTEITSLFGLIVFNHNENTCAPGEISIKLAEEQDLVQFFKYFLYYFQYPGGHLKPLETKKLIEKGVKFKPAKYILNLLQEGEKITEKRFHIDKAELTHCVFNDLRVTRDNVEPSLVVNLLVENRKNGIEYEWEGDIIRYAGDILDYLVIADLLVAHGNKFYLNLAERETIVAFIQNESWFEDYSPFYGRDNITLEEIKITQDNWFRYVNRDLGDNIFKTDLLKYLGVEEQGYEKLVESAIEEFYKDRLDGEFIRTKEIGDFGENLILGHEFMRIKQGDREDLLHLIKKIPTALAMGFDISSVELDTTKRFIEVKTTISNKNVNFFNFHLTPNEWSCADSFRARYFVYRLFITKDASKLFIIQDPVGKYKLDHLRMTPRDGADIIFSEKVGSWEKLLIWKD